MPGAEIFQRVMNTHDHVSLCHACHRQFRTHMLSSPDTVDAWNTRVAGTTWSVRLVDTHDECLMSSPRSDTTT